MSPVLTLFVALYRAIKYLPTTDGAFSTHSVFWKKTSGAKIPSGDSFADRATPYSSRGLSSQCNVLVVSLH